jgi:putative PIG3 family NAD(P)H quinone oxidoreductase
MNLPSEMIEMAISVFGDPDVLRPVRVPTPTPCPGELLVRVAAAGVNRPDVLQRKGEYRPPTDAQPTPGLEIAGEVVAVGAGVSGVGVGDRICGLTNGGGYAQYCRLPASQTLPWPTGFDAVQAAALPETFFTVWANLFQMGKVRAGETVLIHGGASGIGTTAIQLLRAFGIRALATAGSAAKCAAILAIGADVAVNYRQQDFVEVVRTETNGRGVDAILDIVGASYLQRNIAALARDGRLLLLGFMGGEIAERLELGQIVAKRLVITGSAMRPRTVAEKAAIAKDLHAKVWPLLASGRVAPILSATFPLAHAADAHRLMESGNHIGKIVLRVEVGG